MKQILRAPWAKPLAKILAVVMALQYIAICVPPAHAQTTKQTTAVAVVPLTDNTGYKSQVISAKATDAVALALEDSSEFIVTSQADLQREMKALSLAPPLLESEQVRLGKRLRVDKVISGTVESLAIDGKNGRCNVALDIRSLDINTEEYLNGAGVSVTTKPIPGWEGDDVRVINEGLREASEEAVRKMLATRTPRGSVDVVDDNGTITLSVGLRDGVSPGRELLVARPQWQPDQEKVFLRKIGVIAIDHVDADISSAHFVSGLMPRTGDKVYALYKPGLMTEGPKRADLGTVGGHGGSGILGILLGVALIVGLAGAGNGPSNSTASNNVAAVFDSNASRFKITYHTAAGPSDATKGVLLYRFSATESTAQQALIDYRFPDNGADAAFYDDPTTNLTPETISNFTFKYLDPNNPSSTTELTGTVSGTYNHLAMIPGNWYYYRIQRVGTPDATRGAGGPVTTAQVTAASWTMTPPEIGSYISDPTPQFTYISRPTIGASPDSNVGQDPNTITFDWNPAGTGTNDLTIVYVVQIATDLAFTHIVKQSAELPFRSISQPNPEWRATGLGLSGSTAYYWRVTAHVLGETMVFPSSSATPGTFTTVTLPPVVTTAVGSGATATATTPATTPAAGTTAATNPLKRFSHGRRGRFALPTTH